METKAGECFNRKSTKGSTAKVWGVETEERGQYTAESVTLNR